MLLPVVRITGEWLSTVIVCVVRIGVCASANTGTVFTLNKRDLKVDLQTAINLLYIYRVKENQFFLNFSQRVRIL